MATILVTKRRDPRRPLALSAMLGLAVTAVWLAGGCDQEDNNWKVARGGGGPDLALAMEVDLDGGPWAHELAILHYVLTVQNLGDVDAREVVVADSLPEAVTFQQAAPGQGIFDPVTGHWSLGTLAPDAEATLVLTVQVASGTNGQLVENEAVVVAVEPADPWPDNDRAAVSFTVQNAAPVLAVVPAQTIAEGEAFAALHLDGYVTDADDPDETLDWDVVDATALLVVIDAARIATVSAPNSEWSGQETITFQVTDPGGLSAQRAVTFTVTPVNDAPVVSNIPDQSTTAGGAFFPIALDDWVVDVDDPDEQLLWTYSGNGALNVSISAAHVATVTPPSPEWTGEATITFRAIDDGGLSDEDAATFTVRAAR
ncbi:MAG TPA: Ig-like domain-containing protein [Candidatus Krumholzibacteria bacterium]|nr:Ig-like domain-containing protein [Candidatus Krumholzibacteria bacterium]HPD72902.1 Ig-like domain-containing protein [Candidatus Krumholzibacteria bacterium]HRY41701.1 Ig-like domain-containing protein [Candidatus Krumholzibacteria bacterium]